MKAWAPAVAIVLLGLPAAVAADDPKPEPTPVPAVAPSQLKLGPYAGFNLPSAEFAVPELLRFETEVEVRGKSPNEQMFDWWEHFTLATTVYGRGINVANPIAGSSHGYSIVPAFGWTKQQLKKNKMKPEETEKEEESPP